MHEPIITPDVLIVAEDLGISESSVYKWLRRYREASHRVTGDRRSTSKGAGWEYVHIAVDDYSRMAYAEVFESCTAKTCTAFMLQAPRFFRQYGIHARRVMTDNGTGYKPTAK